MSVSEAEKELFLRFYTKPDCPLCDEGLEELEPLAKRHGLAIRKIDIRDDPRDFALHQYRIPVVSLAWGGEEIELGWGRLERSQLDRALRDAQKGSR